MQPGPQQDVSMYSSVSGIYTFTAMSRQGMGERRDECASYGMPLKVKQGYLSTPKQPSSVVQNTNKLNTKPIN